MIKNKSQRRRKPHHAVCARLPLDGVIHRQHVDALPVGYVTASRDRDQVTQAYPQVLSHYLINGRRQKEDSNRQAKTGVKHKQGYRLPLAESVTDR